MLTDNPNDEENPMKTIISISPSLAVSSLSSSSPSLAVSSLSPSLAVSSSLSLSPISMSPRRQIHHRNYSHITASYANNMRSKWSDGITLQVKLPDLTKNNNNNIEIQSSSNSVQIADHGTIVQIQEGCAIRVRRKNPAFGEANRTAEISKLLLQQNNDEDPDFGNASTSAVIPVMFLFAIPLFVLLGWYISTLFWIIGTIVPAAVYILDLIYRRKLIRIVVSQVEYRRTKIMDERKLVNQLLGEIYPEKILQRIRIGEQPILDQYKRTSVLFTDIVGFTQWCSSMSPYTLAIKLNHIYSMFDYLSEKYNVYKVETIGDAYMAVAGCPNRTDDHALRISRFAVSLMGAVEELRHLLHKPDLQIRAGIHSGAVVAGIVGSKRHQFHLYGDTVNMASRMESTSIPNRIHLSEATHIALSGELSCTSRGDIEIKGKGVQSTYMLQLGDMISSYELDITLLSPFEYVYVATELLIRACALNTLECNVDELTELVSKIINDYKQHPDALSRAIIAMHSLNRFLADTDVYQFITEIEIISMLFAALCCNLQNEQQQKIFQYNLFKKCSDRVILVSRIGYVQNTANHNNYSILVKDLDYAVLQNIPNNINNNSKRESIFHELITDSANRWLILAGIYRLVIYINKPFLLSEESDHALISVLNGCLDLSRISPHIFRILRSDV